MKTLLKILAASLLSLLIALLLAAALGYWYAHGKTPQRSGELYLRGLAAPVQVRWDERGVPHIQARNETDLYRALGFLHAQDRLFQMEMMRRLAKGELSEVLGPKLIETDKLFRTLGLRAQAEARVKAINPRHPSWPVLQAYLDGINEFQETRPLPLEFEILGIHNPLPYSAEDTLAVTGYLAYSFAAALRTEPVMTYVRDRLGPDYLRIFDVDWNPLGVMSPQSQLLGSAPQSTGTSDDTRGAVQSLSESDWRTLARVAEVSQEALEFAGVLMLEGSNAWAISGRRTASGRPMLAGDPHIAFSVPAVWWEAHLSVPASTGTPGFELYGHFQALIPYALLGHNQQFGWSLTMFQNDDMDMVALRTNPDNASQVWVPNGSGVNGAAAGANGAGRWVNLASRNEVIEVKGMEPETLLVQQSPYGPIINPVVADMLDASPSATPIALWWTFYDAENPIVEAFYELNRADTLAKARQAASKLHAPGLNIVWANAAGDIGWWAAAKLVQRPAGVNPTFILDSTKGQADKAGYYRFADNPQEENPERGYIVSGNQQPLPKSGVPVYGYYNNPERARRLDQVLKSKRTGWTVADSQTLQLDVQTDYAQRLLRPLLPILRDLASKATENAIEQKILLDQLSEWNGGYESGSIAATIFTQFQYELARAAMADELGPAFFNALLRTRAVGPALARLVADENSPWWDNRATEGRESRADIVARAWRAALAHLIKLHGRAVNRWAWSDNHTLTQKHPLGNVKPLDLLFDVGPYPVAGGREVPNNLSFALGPAPWPVNYGPSTRRVIDFAAPGQAQGISPVGQSGALFDKHYADQALDYALGRSYTMHLDADDVRKSTRSILLLQPDE